MIRRRLRRKSKLGSRVVRAAKFLLKSPLLLVLLGLFVIGFLAGKHACPDSTVIPFEELYENLTVVSYREAPSDSNARFVVEISGGGRPFRQYDVDAQRFVTPIHSRDYGRSISGSRYEPLMVRGHVESGFWLELPHASERGLLPDQFQELYRTTLGFVKPLATVTAVFGTLSGYSLGYRTATWSGSLANPDMQERVLAVPGLGRVLAREAWRRVLIEPVVMSRESDPARFASARDMQRIYTNFFRLALNDSDRFIPREAARLDSVGRSSEARAMLAFAAAARRAAQDTCDLTSADFRAIEDWASLLDRRGHWAAGATPPPGEERIRYMGTLSWYGLAPSKPDEGRLWVGPRVLVRDGDQDGFVADDIPLTRVGCPIAWRSWLGPDRTGMGSNTWTAQWMRESRQVAQFVDFGRDIARSLQGKP